MGQPVFYFLRIFLLNEWLNKISPLDGGGCACLPRPRSGPGPVGRGGGELRIER